MLSILLIVAFPGIAFWLLMGGVAVTRFVVIAGLWLIVIVVLLGFLAVRRDVVFAWPQRITAAPVAGADALDFLL